MSGAAIKVLFLSDTHLGIDLPARPRIERRRRGHDFFANFERALQPALAGEVDLVVHGGDLLYRSKVRAQLVDMAFAPLRRVADAGVPVFVVPGNHERSHIPYRLLAAHPHIHIFDRPRSFGLERAGLRVGLAGFPYWRRDVRGRFAGLLQQTRLSELEADIKLLCLHHCVEGATVGPSGYTFRHGHDVIRARDLPSDCAAVLAGHVHRQQVLRRDLAGQRLATPVLYAGSVERTSLAERDEVKGYMVLRLGPAPPAGGALLEVRRPALPTRPMRAVEIEAGGLSPEVLQRRVQRAIDAQPRDAVLTLRLRGPYRDEALAGLGAARLRAMAPAQMNVSLSMRYNERAVGTLGRSPT